MGLTLYFFFVKTDKVKRSNGELRLLLYVLDVV